jgi:hypothetical protein
MRLHAMLRIFLTLVVATMTVPTGSLHGEVVGVDKGGALSHSLG